MSDPPGEHRREVLAVRRPSRRPVRSRSPAQERPTMASQRKSPMDHPVVVTFLILAVIAAMSLAAEVLKPLALAVLLSFALAPLAGFFERQRLQGAVGPYPQDGATAVIEAALKERSRAEVFDQILVP